MSEKLVDIHLPTRKSGIPSGTYLDEGMGKYGRPELALALAERDLEVVFSRGHGVYDLESGEVQVLRPTIREGHQVFATPLVVAIESIKAIRNVTRIIDHMGDLPELNHPSVRKLARDKVAANELADLLGFNRAFIAWHPDGNLNDALETLPADEIVIKPREGRTSQAIVMATKQELVERAAGGEFDDRAWIIEERLSFAPPIEVKGIDETNQAKINRANRLGLPKELRGYCFGRQENGHLLTSYVVRAPLEETAAYLPSGQCDEWIFIDEDTLPEEIYEDTNRIVEAVEAITGIKEVHIAVDWGRVLRHGEDDPIWLPIELNGSEPQLIRTAQNRQVAEIQTNLMADQIYRVATRGGTK